MMVPAPYNVEDCCELLSSGISFNLYNKNVQHKTMMYSINSLFQNLLDNNSIFGEDIAKVFKFK